MIVCKVTMEDCSQVLVEDLDGAIDIIKSMFGNDDNEKYTFEVVNMTPEEFNDMPEFTGF